MATEKANATENTDGLLKGMVRVKVLADFIIRQNEIYIELKAGATADVPERFIQNLKTEKVI